MNKTSLTVKTTAVICASLFLAACSSGNEPGTGTNSSSTNTAQSSNTESNTTNNSNTESNSNTTNNGNTENNSNTTNNSNTENNSNTTNNSNTENNSNTTSNTDSAGGVALHADKGDMTTAQPASLSGDKDSVITVNGRQITVARPGITAGNFSDISEGGVRTIASGSVLNYMRFGAQTYINANTGISEQYAFAIGNITPTSGADAVPNSGKATYTGLSTFGANNLTFLKGTSDFTVDFGAKTIDGAIQRGTVSEVLLSGNINGASFSGTKDGVTMSGNFFGPNAAELGGVYKGERFDNITNRHESLMGAFGAKKQ